MSRRPMFILAVVLSLATPAAASARPMDSQLPPAVSVTAAAPLPTVQASRDSDSGSGTSTVLAIAGGTLLLGALAGFEGARLRGRRQIART